MAEVDPDDYEEGEERDDDGGGDVVKGFGGLENYFIGQYGLSLC